MSAELFETTIEDKGLSLNCNIPGKVYINGYTRMIQRLFANLMDNAIKYTPPRGATTVKSAKI